MNHRSEFSIPGLPEGTLPETNIAPENGDFQWESPFPGVDFHGLCQFQGRVNMVNG